jgi:hypothetical protein
VSSVHAPLRYSDCPNSIDVQVSKEFLTYGAIVITAVLFALAIVRPKNAVDASRCVGWYLLVFLATYLLRPALSELAGDTLLYRWLKLGNFEDHWYLMAQAVPMAIIFFAVGYAAGGPAAAPRQADDSSSREPVINPAKVRKLIFFLIFLGYVSVVISVKTHTFSGTTGDYEGAAVGVYENSTAWFAQDDLFISTGTILYYITTGSLGTSLALAAPWIGFRVVYGWGRSFLLGHFFALMAVFFLNARSRKSTGRKKASQTMVIGLAILTVLVLFPLMAMLRALKSTFHMGAGAISSDAVSMVQSGADPQDLLQAYVGTDSSIAGFETTLDHLLNDKRSELGTQYLYYYFFEPIPRIVWAGKGTPYSWPEQLRGIPADPLLAIVGAAPGSVGMAYQQWGWLGIPIEFILTGLIMRKAEESVRRRPKVLHLQLAYVGLYSMLPQLGRDSLFYMIPNAWLFRFGIPVFILWLMYRSAAATERVHRRMFVSRGAAPAIATTGEA